MPREVQTVILAHLCIAIEWEDLCAVKIVYMLAGSILGCGTETPGCVLEMAVPCHGALYLFESDTHEDRACGPVIIVWYVCVCICMYVCVCMCVSMCMYVYMCVYMCVCMCVCVCVYDSGSLLDENRCVHVSNRNRRSPSISTVTVQYRVLLSVFVLIPLSYIDPHSALTVT